MRLFKRPAHDAHGDAIAGFWAWWAGEANDRVAAAIVANTLGGLADEIARHVAAIDGRLTWELSDGVESAHSLVVSPEGDAVLRMTALAWQAASPPPDATWEYHASRQPGPLGRLHMGEFELDLTEFRAIAGWDATRERVDVRLWHPALGDAHPDLRLRAAYLFLDHLLGEDGVERWIGEIDLLDDPTGGQTAEELRAEVDRRSAEATGESWVLIERQRGTYEALLNVNLAVKQVDHPFCRHHLVVSVERGFEQLQDADVANAFNIAEDELLETMHGTESVYLGRVTERRRRFMHFVCADAAQADRLARDWTRSHGTYAPKVDIKDDPTWDFRRELGM